MSKEYAKHARQRYKLGEEFRLYAEKDESKEAFQQRFKVATAGFLFVISELLLMRPLTTDQAKLFIDKKVQNDPETFSGERFLINQLPVLTIEMAKDGEGRLFFSYRANVDNIRQLQPLFVRKPLWKKLKSLFRRR